MIKTSWGEVEQWNKGNVLRKGRAADRNTALFWLRNDTTRYFKLSKTRQIPPECITGFSIQIIFEILRGGGRGTCSWAYGKTAT